MESLASDCLMRETRSRTNSGPRRFIGGAAISANSTAPSLCTLSVWNINFANIVTSFDTRRSFHQREERLPFFDDIRGELRRLAAADVARRVDRSGRDEQDVAGFERYRRLALDFVLQRAFENINDLLARLRMLGERYSRADIDADLYGLATRNAEVVLLEIGAIDSRLLRLRDVQRQTADDDLGRFCRYHFSRFHVNLLLIVRIWWHLAQGSERRPDFGRKKLGLLPRREVAALVDFVEVDEVLVGSLNPSPRRAPEFAGEDRECRGNGDLAFVDDPCILPVQPRG